MPEDFLLGTKVQVIANRLCFRGFCKLLQLSTDKLEYSNFFFLIYGEGDLSVIRNRVCNTLGRKVGGREKY